ncbi:hypothetical protein D5086_021758 [Populus alba]|uniref:Uncharacterized protein n=1 Tax=Populus alba TaxID=43335 RepID=A0ACC4BDR4_POPAL
MDGVISIIASNPNAERDRKAGSRKQQRSESLNKEGQEASPSNPQVRSDTDFLIKQVFHRGSGSCLMELFCRKKSGYRIKRDGVSGNDTDFRSGRNNRFALYQNLLQQRTLH